MTTRRSTFAGIAALCALGAGAAGLWRMHATQGMDNAVAANRLAAQQTLRKVCAVSRDPEQVRSIGAVAATAATAAGQVRTLIWSGPQLLYASAPGLTAPAPLLTGVQRAEPGWTGWAEVDLPCGLSVQRFQKLGPG